MSWTSEASKRNSRVKTVRYLEDNKPLKKRPRKKRPRRK